MIFPRLLLFLPAALALAVGPLLVEQAKPVGYVGGPPRFRDLETITMIVLGLPAALLTGVLVDRLGRRTLLVATSLLMAVTAAASWTVLQLFSGSWTLEMNFLPSDVVRLLVIPMTFLAHVALVATEAFTPTAVGMRRLVPVNALLWVTPALIAMPVMELADDLVRPFMVVTRGLIGDLVLPFVAVTTGLAALLLARLDVAETVPEPRKGVWRELAEGVDYTFTHPVLRAIALFLGLSLVADGLIAAGREGLDLRDGWLPDLAEPAALVVLLALWRWTSPLRLAWLAVVVCQPFGLVPFLGIGTAVPMVGWVVASVCLLSLRQEVVPDRLLGRVAVTLGLVLVVAGVGGAVAEVVGRALLPPLAGLVVGTVLATVAVVPLMRRRCRGWRRSPSEPPSHPLAAP